jgi:hypothetical protein
VFLTYADSQPSGSEESATSLRSGSDHQQRMVDCLDLFVLLWQAAEDYLRSRRRNIKSRAARDSESGATPPPRGVRIKSVHDLLPRWNGMLIHMLQVIRGPSGTDRLSEL